MGKVVDTKVRLLYTTAFSVDIRILCTVKSTAGSCMI